MEERFEVYVVVKTKYPSLQRIPLEYVLSIAAPGIVTALAQQCFGAVVPVGKCEKEK